MNTRCSAGTLRNSVPLDIVTNFDMERLFNHAKVVIYFRFIIYFGEDVRNENIEYEMLCL